jgi:hypothetical protein
MTAVEKADADNGEEPTAVERRLLEAAATGKPVDLTMGDSDGDDPSNADLWQAHRNVRAQFLAEVLTGDRATPAGRLRAVKLRGARITGELDLEARTLRCPLLLRDCYLDEPVNLNEAEAVSIRLPGCHVPAINAVQLRAEGDVCFDEKFTATGMVRLSGAQIGGQFSLSGATISCADNYALRAPYVTVRHYMSCEGFTANGGINIGGAKIGEDLTLDGATLSGGIAHALYADGATIGRDLTCTDGFKAHGMVDLARAQVGGLVSFNGAELSVVTGSGNLSLNAHRLNVAADLSCLSGFVTVGDVNLAAAHIGGSLRLSGARLTSKSGRALTCVGMTVADDVLLNAVMVRGELQLTNVRAGGHVFLSGSTLESTAETTAVDLTSTVIGQNVEFQHGFSATGEVSLRDARIGGRLLFSEATIVNAAGTALDADSLTVDSDLRCDDRFTVTGLVSLRFAHVRRQLSFDELSVECETGDAIDATGLTVGQHAFITAVSTSGSVSLNSASIGGSMRIDKINLAASANSDDANALSAPSLTVGGDLLCLDMTAKGEVQLTGAKIGGTFLLENLSIENAAGSGTALDGGDLAVAEDLRCMSLRTRGSVDLTGARVGGDLRFGECELTGQEQIALDATGLTVKGDLAFLGGIETAGLVAHGVTKLTNARVAGTLDLEAAALDDLDLTGATAAALSLPRRRPGGGIDLADAKVGTLTDFESAWPARLNLDGFVYDKLAPNGNTDVRTRLRWLRLNEWGPSPLTPQVYDQLADVYRRAGDDGAARKVAIAKQRRRRHSYSPLNWLWYITVGYGYRTWLAFVWLVGLTLIGSLVFDAGYPAHMSALTAHPPAFQPVIYALDVLIPAAGLGQKSGWEPASTGLWYWYWALTATGWALASAVIAGLTGILKRE